MLYKATRPEFCLTQMLHFTLERLALSLMPTESWSTKKLDCLISDEILEPVEFSEWASRVIHAHVLC